MPKALAIWAGGGMKGMHHFGAEKVLREEQDYEWVYHAGISTGGLAEIFFAQGQPEVGTQLYLDAEKLKIFKKFSLLQLAWRLKVGEKLGIYSMENLGPLVRHYFRHELLKVPMRVGYVSLVTGEYYEAEAVPGKYSFKGEGPFETAIEASATMPLFAEPVEHPLALVDGGLLHMAPLKFAIEQMRAGNPYGFEEVVVFLCSPWELKWSKRPRNIKEAGLRVLDILFHGIMQKDIKNWADFNKFSDCGRTDSEGRRVFCMPLRVIAPRTELGDTIDDSLKTMEWRYVLGQESARAERRMF